MTRNGRRTVALPEPGRRVMEFMFYNWPYFSAGIWFAFLGGVGYLVIHFIVKYW